MNSKLKQLLSLLFMACLIILTGYYILKDQSMATLLETIESVNPLYLLLGLFMMFTFVSCEAFNTFSILRALGQKISYLKCLGFAFVGFYFSSITPSASGGQPAQMFYMNKANIHLSYSSLNLLIITAVYQVVMMIYAFIVFLFNQQFILENLSGIKYFLMFSVCMNTLLTAGILLAMFSKKFIYKLINGVTGILSRLHLIKNVEKKREKLEAMVKEYTKGADYIKTQPLLLLRVILTTTVQLTASYLIPYFVYKAFHLEGFSLFQIISVQSLVSLAVSSIPLPGSVGASENAFMSAFKLLFTTHLILPAMLLCRGISFYSFLIISGIISMIVHLTFTKNKKIPRMPSPDQQSTPWQLKKTY